MNAYLITQLKQGRLNKGLKQSDVTKLTGIKNTTLSNYENGITEPDIDTFLLLCELYHLNYATILAEAYGLKISGTDFNIKPSEMECIEKYRNYESGSIYRKRAAFPTKSITAPLLNTIGKKFTKNLLYFLP